MELNTYGDLKKVIKAITLKQKGEKIGDVALGTLLGFIPGAEAAKTTFDFVKAAFSKPDTKKTKTWLDKLDIDDEMSAIVDDTVENGFLQTLTNTIDNESDNKPLEQDFNMNAKMVAYLKQQYSGRTISGIQENKNKMKNEALKKLIKQMIVEEITQTSTTKQYSKATQSNQSLASKAKQIDTIQEFPAAFQAWFDSLGLKGKTGVNKNTLLTKMRDVLTQMGVD